MEPQIVLCYTAQLLHGPYFPSIQYTKSDSIHEYTVYMKTVGGKKSG